jgi:tyrosyl-tRNA synthetase
MSSISSSQAAAEMAPLRNESVTIHPIFVEQAKHLAAGGECLPGGVQGLAQRLAQAAHEERPLRIKLGLDPTRPDLHVGHSVVLRKLRAFQDLGHQAVLIIGDATAMVGDPSGRNQTRPPLTEAEIQINAQTYLDQAGKIIDTDKAEIVRNSQFFKDMGLASFLHLASQVTVAQLMTRDDFSKRYAANTPISLHEFFYPLMQAYDSVMVNADLELGGSDQRFNNLLGRDMQLAFAKADQAVNPQMVLLMPLLEGTDGVVKMSKSYPQHCINFTDAPEDMFGKLMSIPDALIIRYESLLTPLTPEQLQQHEQLMQLSVDQGGINPRDVKASLARFVVGTFHDAMAAEAAEQAFIDRFRNKVIPNEMPEHALAAQVAHPVVEVLVATQLAPSKAQARRLIEGGGVKLDGQTKVNSFEETITGLAGHPIVLQVGKRHFVRLLFG